MIDAKEYVLESFKMPEIGSVWCGLLYGLTHKLVVTHVNDKKGEVTLKIAGEHSNSTWLYRIVKFYATYRPA